MRSVIADDLTTQARIRDAAIARFPIDGMKGTTIRAVATDAGVSPGLVIHHFGSKEGLHRACDEYVIHRIMGIKRESIRLGSHRQPGTVGELYQLSEPALRYLAWTLGTGGETAARIFDDLLDETVQLFEESSQTGIIGKIHGDPRRQAAVLVATQMATLVFHEHLSRAFGVDMLSAEGLITAAPYALQILSGDLFDRDVIEETRATLRELTDDREE